MADIAALSMIIFIVEFGRTSRRAAVRAASTSVLVLCSVAALIQIYRWCNGFLYAALPPKSILVLKLIVMGGALFVIVCAPRKFKRTLKALFLIVTPVFPIFAVHALWSYATVDLHRTGAGRATAPYLRVAPDSQRVVWVIFDELDERLLFDARPQRIRVPEFDRLRAESVFADHAEPPGPETLWSMPSFLLGQRIYNPRMDTSRLSVQFPAGGTWHEFTAQPNVFRRARAEGFNTGLTGWYLPYCRLIGGDLSDCTWASLGPAVVCAENLLRHQTFYQRMKYLIGWDIRIMFRQMVSYGLLDATPEDALSRQYQNVNAVKVVTQNGIRMLRDPRLNLLLIHVPAPHPPGIWNTREQTFAFNHTDYLDNYELADAVLGQIRRTLEDSGNWDRTTLLVTSDHPYRTQLWMYEHIWNAEMTAITGTRTCPYVPFFLKLPFHRQGALYERKFNNVLSGSLLLEVLRGHIQTPEQAVAWIGRH